jgi:3-phosphoshikimate 1-carboxyvinyltransferase
MIAAGSEFVVEPARRLSGSLTVPPDKSISHRAVILAALAEGETAIRGCLLADDCQRTLAAMAAMGVAIEPSPNVVADEPGESGDFRIRGRGMRLAAPAASLDMGNSGTSMRLLLGLLAGQSFRATLIGDASLSSRPMRRVVDPLRWMGAEISGRDDANHAPLEIRGGTLRPINYTMPVASAQVKSAILLAGLYADGITRVHEPAPTRDHTERMLPLFGVTPQTDGRTVAIRGGALRAPREPFTVPGDFSSAMFWLVAASIVPHSTLTLRGVGFNPTRIAGLSTLTRMGAFIEPPCGGAAPSQTEASGDFQVASRPLRATVIEGSEVAQAIDELPIVMVAACCAEGRTVIRGAGELRVKETDRITSMVTGLSRMGARIQAEGDDIIIEGPASLAGCDVDSFGDHRTAMSLIVAGLVAHGQTRVHGVECIRISYPGFLDTLRQLTRAS